MISKLLLCVFWAAVITASSDLDSLGQSVVATTSTQPALARPGVAARTVGLRKRTDNITQACDSSEMTWYGMVKAYSEKNRQSLNSSLTKVLAESGMTLTGNLSLASSPYDPNRVFCDIFPKASGNSGTSFPKCLLEAAIDGFCTVSQDVQMDENYPFSVKSKGGLWKTYKFYGYSISGLYIAVEISKAPEYDGHRRTLYAYNSKRPDRRCKEKLLGEIVDRCQTGSTYIKFGGVALDSCETWAIYPLPPYVNATWGSTVALGATAPGSTVYPTCGSFVLSGVFPTEGSWSTPTAPDQATVTAASVKTDLRSADTTETTEGGHKIKRTDTLTNLVARETGKAASKVPAGPGRRQLVGL